MTDTRNLKADERTAEDSLEKHRRRSAQTMTLLTLGIRGKINVALGGIICLATVAFGTGYALLERNAVLEAERVHLHHLAALAEIQISKAAGAEELDEILSDFERGLFEATKVRHELVVTTADGAVIATSARSEIDLSNRRPPHTDEPTGLDLLLPRALKVTTPLRSNQYTSDGAHHQPEWLMISEPLDGLRQQILTSLLRHFLFAGGLVTVTMLFVGAIVHRLVVRPVRELAAATESIGRDGDWDPVQPDTRRDDEIGVLADRIAIMSRRLVPAVRNERFGSAHLVAERVRRELDEPLRRVTIQLEMLKGVAADPDQARACDEIDMAIQEIAEIGRRLGEIRSAPPA